MSYGKNHWVKLYVEIVDDAKVGLLPVNAKWRFVSCLALAGELDEGGFLPPVDDLLAYRLRADVETINAEMRLLAGRGLAELRMHPDGEERWFMTNFEQRQRPTSNAERQRQWRKRNEASNDDITKRYASVTKKQKQNTETEAEAEGEKNGAGAPAPSPTSSPPFQPIPENVQAAKARTGRGEPEPDLVVSAPPAVRLLAQLTGYWPGENVVPSLVDRLGDAPQEVALARAVELWRLSGNKPTNWLGITDWYDELCRNPDWTPQLRFKTGPAGANAAGPALSPSERAAAEYATIKRNLTGGR